jgi:Flp pilus assembly protein TadG
MAVVMPVIILLVLVPFQVGLWWHANQVATAAAREAVDAAQVETATDADGVEAAFRFLDAAGNLSDPQVTVSRTPTDVTAEVSGEAPVLVPGISWSVSATATGATERFIPEPDR